jgi:hypothetical protein
VKALAPGTLSPGSTLVGLPFILPYCYRTNAGASMYAHGISPDPLGHFQSGASRSSSRLGATRRRVKSQLLRLVGVLRAITQVHLETLDITRGGGRIKVAASRTTISDLAELVIMKLKDFLRSVI